MSAGFDCHHRDPLGGMEVTEEGFRAMTRSLLSVARDCSEGRLLAILEGGYDLDAIRNSSRAVLEEICRPDPPAAEMLGLSRQSLYLKLRRHGLIDFSPDSGTEASPAQDIDSSR